MSHQVYRQPVSITQCLVVESAGADIFVRFSLHAAGATLNMFETDLHMHSYQSGSCNRTKNMANQRTLTQAANLWTAYEGSCSST